MTNIQITVTLPAELVEEARESGVLTDENIAALLQAEIDRQKHVRSFLDIANQLAAAEPKLTLEEIEAEIAAARQADK